MDGVSERKGKLSHLTSTRAWMLKVARAGCAVERCAEGRKAISMRSVAVYMEIGELKQINKSNDRWQR